MIPDPTPTAQQTTENPSPRAGNGRFARGNRGGPGNPFARQTAQLRQAMLDAVSPADMRLVIDAVKKKAADGDLAACKLLVSYCVGKPVAPVDPDTLDQHELKTIIGNHLDSAEGPLNILKGMPLDILVGLFELLLPLLRSEKEKLAKQVLCAPLTEEEIEDNQADHDDDVADEKTATAPAGDPFATIPEWMMNIGKEAPEQPAPAAQQASAGAVKNDGVKGADKHKKTAHARPAPAAKAHSPHLPGGLASQAGEGSVHAERLRVLLEQVRSLTAGTGSADNGKPPHGTDMLAELLKMVPGSRPPSANGANGTKPPSANGANGKK